MDKKIPSKDRQIELLTTALKDIFGYNAKVSMEKWEPELDQIVVTDVEFSEDLLTILKRLRESFMIVIEAEPYEDTWKEKGKRKLQVHHRARIVITLYRREQV